MAGRPPKPAHLRQNRTRKAGRAELVPVGDGFGGAVPDIPNPDGREWHALTVASWRNAWTSPMAAQYLRADVDAFGRLAVLWDDFYQRPEPRVLAEIRLQEMRFGLTPLDRSRLQWEVARGDEAERKRPKPEPARKAGSDPRRILRAV